MCRSGRGTLLGRGVRLQRPCIGNMCLQETARRPGGLDLGETCGWIGNILGADGLCRWTGYGACEGGPAFMT